MRTFTVTWTLGDVIIVMTLVKWNWVQELSAQVTPPPPPHPARPFPSPFVLPSPWSILHSPLPFLHSTPSFQHLQIEAHGENEENTPVQILAEQLELAVDSFLNSPSPSFFSLYLLSFFSPRNLFCTGPKKWRCHHSYSKVLIKIVH